MKEWFKKIFTRKKRTIQFMWKHSLNDEVIIYPTEDGWKKIHTLLGEKYIEDHTTENGGYKDLLRTIVEDLHPLFYHGSKYLHSSFEIIEKL